MSNNIIKTIFLIILLCSCNIANAKIMTINSLNDEFVKKLLSWADKDTVIIIEIDGTITMPKSAMFSHKDNPYRGFIPNLVKLGKRNNSYNEMIAKWYQQRQVKLVDQQWPKLIELLKTKGAKVYGICSTPVQLVNIEKKLMLELNNFGVMFTPEAINQSKFIIKKEDNWFAHFYEGILFTGPYTQSRTILDFLRKTYLPKKLMVFSHQNREIDWIDEKLRVFNMKFYSVNYQGAKSSSEKPIAEVVKLQQKELMLNYRWLEDDQVKSILNYDPNKEIDAK